MMSVVVVVVVVVTAAIPDEDKEEDNDDDEEANFLVAPGRVFHPKCCHNLKTVRCNISHN
jgi:hypothetical protein